MPLPLIPVALGLLSAGTALFGAKKGLDAKSSLDRATSDMRAAAAEFEAERERVDAQRATTDQALQRLGAKRLKASAGPMKRFVDAASQVHQVERKSLAELDRPQDVETPEIAEMRISAYESADLLKDGLGAVPAGVLTGAGAMGAVGWLGTASTGASISGLTGVAASNATLAWLGGGSLAAGGWGVAGGTAVLGGLVAGPVIAVMGLSMASRMNKEATRATEQEADYRVASEQLRNAVVVLRALDQRCDEIGQAISGLSRRFTPVVARLEAMVAGRSELRDQLQTELDERRAAHARLGWWVRLWRRLFGKREEWGFDDPLDFNHFSQQDRQLYLKASTLAYAMHALLKVRLLDEEGQPLPVGPLPGASAQDCEAAVSHEDEEAQGVAA